MTRPTKVQICNMALVILGIEEEVENIDTPATRWEKRCAQFYDIARRQTLTLLIPSFAVTPDPLSVTKNTKDQFPIPQDCLRILRVNGRANNFHEIGGTIKCDFPTQANLEIEYIIDVVDTGRFSPEFCLAFANELAILLAPLTKEQSKINYASNVLVQRRNEYAGINAMKIKSKKIDQVPFIGKGWFYRR